MGGIASVVRRNAVGARGQRARQRCDAGGVDQTAADGRSTVIERHFAGRGRCPRKCGNSPLYREWRAGSHRIRVDGERRGSK